MNEELKAALADISAPAVNNSQCWAMGLPDEALELLHAIEGLVRDGKSMNRRIAADKFNELYEITTMPITDGMVGHHLNSKPGNRCACQKVRDYL